MATEPPPFDLWDCWDPDGSPEQHLRNLLAYIHRDGGHHAGRHGLAESCQRAAEIVIELRRKVEANEKIDPGF